MPTVSELINLDPLFAGPLNESLSIRRAPVSATPAIAVTAAKVAGAIIGAGAVCGAAYGAYRAVAR